jgi:glycosyltransferase involved in cell wall biosynthesis
LDLLAAVWSVGDSVELDVVTSCPSDLPSQLPSNVRVHTDVEANSPVMSELYGRSEVFVLPTRGDCTPLVIAEAMASGLPIVATTVGSIPDMVRDGHNGILVPPRQPSALSAALTRLAMNRDLTTAMGEASRRMAEAEHDSLANCRQIFKLMREVTNTSMDLTVEV